MITDTQTETRPPRQMRGDGYAKSHTARRETPRVHATGPRYGAIWGWLMGLLGLGLALAYLPIPKWMIVTLIFGTAVIKATLVGYHYMHLRFERVVVYTIALTPILVLAILLFGLIPDIGLRR